MWASCLGFLYICGWFWFLLSFMSLLLQTWQQDNNSKLLLFCLCCHSCLTVKLHLFLLLEILSVIWMKNKFLIFFMCRICIKDIQVKLCRGFSRQENGMSLKLTKWFVCSFLTNLWVLIPFHWMLEFCLLNLRIIGLFQLLDCLNWRINNDIDSVLSVSSSFLLWN